MAVRSSLRFVLSDGVLERSISPSAASRGLALIGPYVGLVLAANHSWSMEIPGSSTQPAVAGLLHRTGLPRRSQATGHCCIGRDLVRLP